MTKTALTAWPKNSQRKSSNPFIGDGFLSALEDSGVCSKESGWSPHHIYLSDDLIIPCYEKNHSWGEYVFDFAWANAYEQYGLDYYPKLVIAAPFTPSLGPRFIGAKHETDIISSIDALQEVTRQRQISGFHILFPNKPEQKWLDSQNLLKRTDVQFHWTNRDYTNFDDFLDRFSSRKRKNVRKERKSIHDQGITMSTLEGNDITDQHWDAFYNFYHATYLKRGRQGYLNKAFFDLLLERMKDDMVLIMAEKDNTSIAGALFFKDASTLYGRYWGCFEEFNNLHFEACYYQGIEYCIRNGLERFDPGTQGEHKIARGFEPTMTHSYHWLAHPQFFEAAKKFCEDEAQMTQRYFEQTTLALPFKTLEQP
jgi:predicted N-acyltransferase